MEERTILNNSDLHQARQTKADEFYTSYNDVDAELSHYTTFLKGKNVYCPCDTSKSSFFNWFKNNYHRLELSGLTATSYSPETGHGFIYRYDGDYLSVGRLVGNGDFASDECRLLMKDADVIATNPPFSLFRKFMQTVRESGSYFLVIGNINAVTYKEIFPWIVEKETMLGVSIHSGDREFRVPDDYPLEGTACRQDSETLQKFIRVKGVRWFTNIWGIDERVNKSVVDFGNGILYVLENVGNNVENISENVGDSSLISHLNMDLANTNKTSNSQKVRILTEKFSTEKYQKFDTYEAYNVNSMKEIPYDSENLELGVPITVIDSMNDDNLLEFKTESGEQILFEIIGMLNSGGRPELYDFAKPIIDGKCKFKRLIIKRVN